MSQPQYLTRVQDDNQQLQQLLNNPAAFSFERAISVLEQALLIAGFDPELALDIVPSLSLKVQQQSVLSVTEKEQGGYCVEVNLFGLYGANSPLPKQDTIKLQSYEQDDLRAPKQFLDLIHKRLYRLYLDALRKYDVLTQVVEKQNQDYSQLLHAFSGSLGRDDVLPDIAQLLKFAPLFNQPRRGILGLEQILNELLSDIPFTIEQCAERKFLVPAQFKNALGKQCHELGNDLMLGDQLKDRHSKLAIKMGPISQARFDALVNEPTQWQTLVKFIRFYLNTPLEVELQISVPKTEAQQIQLGQQKWGQLGFDTWCFNQASLAKSQDSDAVFINRLKVN